jgi:hypothetical protein
MQTGTLYDFSAYSMDYALIDGGTVYAQGDVSNYTSWRTIYKIALGSNMQAVPLNNAAYNPATIIRIRVGDGIVAGGWFDGTVFSTSGAFTPKDVSLDWYLSSSSFKRAIITDDNGDVWRCQVHTDSDNPNPPDYEFGYYEREKVTLSSSGEIEYETAAETISPIPFHGGHHELAVSPTEYVWYNSSEFHHLYKDQSGIQFSYGSFASPVSGLSLSSNPAIYQDGYLYWLSGTSIYRIALMNGAAETVIYTNPNILSTTSGDRKLSVSGDTLFFYAYADAITINTYALPANGPYTPELLSTSTAEIRDIVELAF